MGFLFNKIALIPKGSNKTSWKIRRLNYLLAHLNVYSFQSVSKYMSVEMLEIALIRERVKYHFLSKIYCKWKEQLEQAVPFQRE